MNRFWIFYGRLSPPPVGEGGRGGKKFPSTRLIGPCVFLAGLACLPSLRSGSARKPDLSPRPDFYTGEGWAELGADTGLAREQAKSRALGDLARNVRVTVRSAIIDVLGQTAGQTRQSLESKINTYAEIPATGLDREEFILNEPRRGQLTCRVAVHRARYDGEVRRDLLNKKNRALEEARLAHAAFRDGRLAEAWNALVSLENRAAADFPNLALDGDADGDGKTEDVLLWGRDRRRHIRGSLKIACSPGPFIFGNDGRYAGDVIAQLSWVGTGSVRLEGFPLRARWTHRPESVAAEIFADKKGAAAFHPTVDLFVESAFLQVEPAGGDGGPDAACRSPFHRRRQAVVAVRADRDGLQTKITEAAVARLKRFPWDVRADEEDLPPRGSTSRISLAAHSNVVRHPEGEIYRATLAIEAGIYSGFLGKEVFQGQGPTAVAFGATPAEAVRLGLENLLQQLGPWLDGKVKELP